MRVYKWSREQERFVVPFLKLLRYWVGRGERGGNNAGWFCDYITQGKGSPWCAALMYTAMEDTCATLGMAEPFHRTHWAREFLESVQRVGHRITDLEHLQPGDFVCLPRGNDGRQGHLLCIYRRTDTPGVYVAIDGNRAPRAAPRVRLFEINLLEIEIVGAGRLGEFWKMGLDNDSYAYAFDDTSSVTTSVSMVTAYSKTFTNLPRGIWKVEWSANAVDSGSGSVEVQFSVAGTDTGNLDVLTYTGGNQYTGWDVYEHAGGDLTCLFEFSHNGGLTATLNNKKILLTRIGSK